MFNPKGYDYPKKDADFDEDPFYLSSIQKNQEDQGYFNNTFIKKRKKPFFYFYIKDREIAYKLQKKYIMQANALQEEEKYEEPKKNKHKQRGPKPENFEEPEPKYNEEMRMPGEEDDLHVNNKPFKKEKKSFSEKIRCFY